MMEFFVVVSTSPGIWVTKVIVIEEVIMGNPFGFSTV